MALAVAPKTPSDVADLARPPKSLGREAWERLLRNRASVAGMIVVAVFVIVAIFARQLAPFNPLEIHSGKAYLPPVWIKISSSGHTSEAQYLLGTDTLGRDVLSRVIFGARISMIVGFIPTTIILLLGTFIGMISGFYGGTVDNLLMRFTDIIYGFPDLLFFVSIMVALRDTWIGQLFNGLFLLFSALAIVNWVGVARIVRGQVLSLKEKEFIEAARCIGARDSRIMFRHLLPNVLSPLIVLSAFRIPGSIIAEATLGYLGIGVRPATDPASTFLTSWGQMMLEGQTSINAQPWILLAPAISVALVVLAFTFLGDGLRDALDPRMRGTQ